MTVTIRHRDGMQFEAEARGHRLICDQPPSNGGQDTGMTPPELLLASLGACAGFYAVEYLKARALPVEGVSVRISAEKVPQPARLGAFRIEITAPVLDEKHTAGLLRAVRSCLIHNTLLNAPAVETVVNAPSPAAV